jgi:small multidrug resistance pump
MHWICLLIAITGEVSGTSALKASEGFTKVMPSAVTVIGFAVAFYFLALTLKIVPIGIAYAIWSGVGIVMISMIGYLWFGQSLDGPALVGIGMIIAGVVVINTLSQSTSH